MMDSVYKKVKNDTATDFEKMALSKYYMVTHLKDSEYLEYKYNYDVSKDRRLTNMKIRPIGDRIVIKVIEDTAQTEGGIFIPDSAKEKPQKGEVLAAGPGELNKEGKRDEMEVKVGDTVLFAKYSFSSLA